MGARGTRHVISELQAMGFQPIELERYATSNKIWSTKIKRLRLPDLLCVRTGLRVEVRAKASLEIRMSHAPKNPDRQWDTGLRSEDVIALITCKEVNGTATPVGRASYFGVEDLRQSVDTRQLSAMKSASEGAEQYLTWPSIVSSRPGKVLAVDVDRLSVEWGGDGGLPRRYAYQLKGKRPYVAAGQVFPAETMILAGAPPCVAHLSAYRAHAYLPLNGLRSVNLIDRYSAVKAIPFRPDVEAAARSVLEAMVGRETDQRLGLEVAGSAATLGLEAGAAYIHDALWGATDEPMRMEAVFITIEVGRRANAARAAEQLANLAGDVTRFGGHEVRQAAVWGLGRTGLRAYGQLISFIADPDDNVALHAIAAFGSDTPAPVVQRLVAGLHHADTRRIASSSETLRWIGNEAVLRSLIDAARQGHPARTWVIATLGRLPEAMLRAALAGDQLLDELAPLLLITSGGWLSPEDVGADLRFLAKQIV